MKSLKLFGVVPTLSDMHHPTPQDLSILDAYGVVLAPSAQPFRQEIYAFLRTCELSPAQLNNTAFYRSWKKVASVSELQRIHDQIWHYLSTYGLQELSLADPEYIYIPVDEYQEQAPQLALRVIRGVPREQIVAACLGLIGRSIALQQETIQEIIGCLIEECGYVFTGREQIRNHEAVVLIADRTGILPQRGEDLFRYLIYKTTNETMVVKNDRLIAQIQASRFVLPDFNDDRLIALAASFHRMKALWMAFKKAHPHNGPIVNRVAKLAKRHHQPLPVNVLQSLTATVFAVEEVTTAARRATTPQLVRALNAVRSYQQTDSRFYRIRNGTSYAIHDTRSREHIPFDRYHTILRAELQFRCREHSIKPSAYLDVAFPISQKQYTGAIPAWTQVRIPHTGHHILVGVYWENGDAGHVDLDLSAIAEGSKVGWDADWRTGDRGLLYSGDITDAPTGASEWMYGRTIEQPYLITLNAYRAPAEHPFKLIVGYGDRDEGQYENYLIDPNNVLFTADGVMHQRQILLGILIPADDGGMSFVLVNQALGNKIVSRNGPYEQIARESLRVQAQTTVLLREVITEHADGIDLTNLSLDTLMPLLD